MARERGEQAPSLQQSLAPVLKQLRSLPADDLAGRYHVSKEWFGTHTQNMVSDVKQLAFLCMLPREERMFVTYPVIGNIILEDLQTLQPQNDMQARALPLVRQLITEKRFNNSHTEKFYEFPENYERTVDTLSTILLEDPVFAQYLEDRLNKTALDIATAIDNKTLRRSKRQTSDYGHGLTAPAMSFTYDVEYVAALSRHEMTQPLDATIMIVDDQQPKDWYNRMIAAGFKDIPGQQGYFTDCESALEALKTGHYDVILSDIDLGEGKMRGPEFAEAAYDIQQKKGILPLISLFSYDEGALFEADMQLGISGGRAAPVFFEQTSRNTKTTFNAIHFREMVGYALRRREN